MLIAAAGIILEQIYGGEIMMKSYINKQRLQDVFLEIVRVDTGSDADSPISPSTEKQLVLAEILRLKLIDLGLKDVRLDKYGIVSGCLPSNLSVSEPVVGFIAHMDTSPDVATGPVQPLLHQYTAGDISLQNDIVISAEMLKKYKGQTIVTSDGTTLLGADDKAGVAEILEMLAVFKDNPRLPRPELKIAFTPDEEVGRGTEHFDIVEFGADFAYTVDGSAPEDIDTETFNAFNPKITIIGVPVHTGYAYGKMVSAVEIATLFMNSLPADETPATTKEKEGYFHVLNISGTPAEVRIDMLVRDFDYLRAQKRIAFLQCILDDLQRRYPEAKISFDANEKYHNMKEKFAAFPELLEITKEAVRRSNLKPAETYVRGGTDGAELTLRGLLTPNLGAGGENFHSLNEFVSLDCMIKCTENLLNLAALWAERGAALADKIKAISPCRG